MKERISQTITIINSMRRRLAQIFDQVVAVVYKKIAISPTGIKFDGQARFTLLTVNYSTTYYLKLMLLTLSKQNNLDKLKQIIVVDNNSKDGSSQFLQQLNIRSKAIHVISNKWFCHHARGLRLGINALDQIEKKLTCQQKSNVLMICDTDIVFRNPETVSSLAKVFERKQAAFAGELRYSDHVCPQAQASFLCLLRECYERKDIQPFVYHGSPAYWLQKSLWKAGLYLHDFRSNFAGYILHRGRSGVAAAKQYKPLSSFTTVNNQAHYMGVKNGKEIWQNIEKQHQELLKKENQQQLIDHLVRSFV